MAPQNVGIKAIEVYIPTNYVNQSDLEKFDEIPAGKYTIGLGQTNMAFVSDREDIYSLSKTVGFLDHFDYSAFHVPTCKLVTKSFARMLYNDFLSNPEKFKGKLDQETFDQVSVSYEQSLTDRNVEKVFLGLAKEESNRRLASALKVPTNTGNMYTASCWASLSSVLYFVGSQELQNKRISIFSYGSGLASTLLSVKVVGDISPITKVLNLDYKLNEGRQKKTPEEYVQHIALREKAHLQKSFKPQGSVDDIAPGAYYLVNIDDKFQRTYEIKK
ncbi:hypothetical protein HF325_003704 [Metschnikowia pulcherrima]|uniref:Hydroxymethylglutaryl-coenzyme A synthase C-terminal domain-containing protein n=1 Tax=Metschnikowia pulcherrima TaxID=27326 RepID=A0A8H7GS97_9ASCO|nr:hypothetical protein HF325_003704 [Metschnikowia pulcherrima]